MLQSPCVWSQAVLLNNAAPALAALGDRLVVMLDDEALARTFAANVGAWTRIAHRPVHIDSFAEFGTNDSTVLGHVLDGARGVVSELCDAARFASGQARSTALGELFVWIACWGLDAAGAASVRAEVVDILDGLIGKRDYDRLLAIASKTQEVPGDDDGDVAEIDPAMMDFGRAGQGLVGHDLFYIVHRTIVRKQGRETQVERVPHIVTSSRGRHIADKPANWVGERLLVFGERPCTPSVTRPERWPKACVDRFLAGEKCHPAHMFANISTILAKYLVMSVVEDLIVLAVWIIGTYLFCMFTSYPYLHITGPKDSGKSRILDLLFFLAYDALHTASMSPAVLFRQVGSRGCTVLLDEAENLGSRGDRAEELLTLFNAGYRRLGFAQRLEKVDDSFELREYGLFSPKALAGIRTLPATLSSRAHRIQMIRAHSTDPIARRVLNDDSENWPELRHQLYMFGLQFAHEVANRLEHRDDLQLFGARKGELWFPLLVIADILDAHGVSNAVQTLRKRAEAPCDTGEDISPADAAFLHALLEIARQKTQDSASTDTPLIQPKEIAQEIRIQSGQLFTDRERQNLAKRCGHWLKRYGFGSKRRTGQGMQYEITFAEAKELASRYGIHPDAPEDCTEEPHETLF